METVKVSIVVPIYNTEKYLKRCFDSLVGQTLDDIEIIAVDNHSSDSSPEIIRSYATQYPGKIVPFFSEVNRRQAASRNRGIQMATGEYLLFVDSDDWIELDTCKRLYEVAAETGADMVGGDCYYSTDSADVLTKYNYPDSALGGGTFDPEVLACYCRECGLFWSRLYKRDMVVNNNIEFMANPPTMNDDSPFNFITALYARNVVKTDYAFYHYYIREDSITHKQNNPLLRSRIDVAKYITETCQKQNIYPTFKELVDWKSISHLVSMVWSVFSNLIQPDIQMLNEVRDCVRERYPQYRKNKYYSTISLKMRVVFEIVMASPQLAIWTIAPTSRLYKMLKR